MERAKESAIDAIETIVAFYLAALAAREVTEYCELPDASDSVAALHAENDRLGHKIPKRILSHAVDILTDCEGENLEDIVREIALSVEVRSAWQEPSYSPKFDEYRILFTFGGPNIWFLGELDSHDEPSSIVDVQAYWGDSAYRSDVRYAGVPFGAKALEWFTSLFVYCKL